MPDGLTPPPEVIADLASSCVRFVDGALGLPLDYTQDTLPVLDHYLRTLPKDAAEEILSLLVPAAGAYFGEVVRRHFGQGTWATEGDYASWRLLLPPGPLRFNPIGMALEVASREAAAGWGPELDVPAAARDSVDKAVSALGDVRESDYYTLGVRLEVLEQVRNALVASAGSLPS